MARPKLIALVAGGALLAMSPAVTAQRLGGSQPRNGACFYEDANYRGDYFCLDTGRDLSSITSRMNDWITSIRVFGDAEVTVFEDSRFRGDSRFYDDDVRNLGRGWNDMISSVRVDRRRETSQSRDRDRGNSVSSQQADRIVRRAYEDILDREPDTAGLRLYRSRMVDDGWTEQEVREALRTSPEYVEKNTMTRAKAVQVVRAAYLAVLKREPDPGASNYIDHVFRDKWAQADVERELRKSAEYRNR